MSWFAFSLIEIEGKPLYATSPDARRSWRACHDPFCQATVPMDYAKSGNAKNPKGTPRFDAQNLHGAPKDKHGNTPDKAALLARLKAAAAAKKQG